MNKFEDILAKVNSIKMYKALDYGVYYAEGYDGSNKYFDYSDDTLESLFDLILLHLSNKTDPYGSLSYCVGNEDDFWCFDYHIENDYVLLHAVINSETGAFIQDAEKVVVYKSIAMEKALEMVDAAIEWCNDNDISPEEQGKFITDIERDVKQWANMIGITIHPMSLNRHASFVAKILINASAQNVLFAVLLVILLVMKIMA